MNKKSMVCVILSVVMIIGGFSMGGCQLAKEDAAEGALGDKLIGIYITMDTINPLDWFSGEPKYADDEKIYATKVEVPIEDTEYTTCEYRFEGFEGIPLFDVYVQGDGESEGYRSFMINESVFDACQSMDYVDNGCDMKMSGKIYLTESVILYSNPVYQEADGDVYMVPADMGEEVSKYTSGHTSWIERDSKDGRVMVEVSFGLVGKPECVSIVAMDKEDKILWQEIYKEGQAPDKLQVPENTEYFIVKTSFKDGKEFRIDTYTKVDSYITLFKSGSSAVLEGEHVELKWE